MKQFEVPSIYRSKLISLIKEKRKLADKMKKDFSPTLLDFGDVHIYLARHFGFCYGVENAIDIAFRTIDENPGKKIYLLSEMIHNPKVNEDLKNKGVEFLQDTYGKNLISFDQLKPNDIVLIPAFGTTLEMEEFFKQKSILTKTYNTTCPFVEKVWNRSAQIANKGYSIVIHGKPKHEETRATFSHASANAASVIVNDMEDAILLAQYITGEKSNNSFYEDFKNKFSEGFDVEKDLKRIGVVNQTTQLASDTQEISDYLKNIITSHFKLTQETITNHFADTRDTLCYATNDNQTAVAGMLQTDAHFAIVIGGYNSSNTSHLVELCEEKLPTYFIDSAERIISSTEIQHCNWQTKEEITSQHYMPTDATPKILITSGASCPDALVEQVIERILEITNSTKKMNEIIMELETNDIS